MKFFRAIDRFFFARISATGFGLMRAVWGAGVLIYLLKQWPDVTRYYAAGGQLPPWFSDGMANGLPSTSVLWLLPSAQGVELVHAFAVLLAFCACLGIWPRLSTIGTFLLLCSFHVRNPWHTTGGDVIFRSLGLILSIAPGGVTAFSFARGKAQLRHWLKTKKLLPAAQMPVWPRRLVLFQIIVIYLQSVWSKSLGTMWWNGTAVGIALHHTHFGRFATTSFADALGAYGPYLGWGAMLWEASWVFMLIPGKWLPWKIGTFIRRFLLTSSLFIHTAWAILLRLGSFWSAIPAILLGNMHGEDFVALRKLVNLRWRGKISVFYDSHCGFCTRSTGILVLTDWLKRLRPVDFHSKKERELWAPDLPIAKLDRAMHVRFPSGKTLHGFSAFRALTWHLPALWLAAPLLYLPGVKPVGDRVYTRIAAKRKKCTHKNCAV